ncbi:tetratricopeptide repeat protein [Thalassospira mesophila]|uniref:tetratricopeptide repeat protein n=1 Tax=Thalassospira mesophila TaxID=1293891 RepID=UPI00117FCEFB|nr:tetratricopeptide repeat protein [Thalassospira mesophila]
MIWWGIAGLSLLSFATVFFTAFWHGKTGDAGQTMPQTDLPPAAAPTQTTATAKPKYQIGDVVDDDDDDDDDDDLDDDFGYIEYRTAQARNDATLNPRAVAGAQSLIIGGQDAIVSANAGAAADARTDVNLPKTGATTKNTKNLIFASVFAAVPVIAAFGIYIWQGHPDMPARPYAERTSERNIAAAAAAAADPDDPDAQTDKQIRRLLGQIVISLESNPRNLQGWLVLARGSLRLGDIERAVAAYRRAYALSGQNPLLAIEYADTRITAQGGQIDEISRNLVLHALGQMPNHRLSRYYYGIMLEQQGHLMQSLHVLRDLIHDLPADAPLSASTAAEIASLEAQLEASENNKNSATNRSN